jgi:ubiquinone/menaquinone biosynthesis C-methylase UbiE
LFELSQHDIRHSRENFREFYESVGNFYPEEDLVYRTLRGILRRQFVLSYLARFQGRLLDLGCNRGAYLSHYHQGSSVGIDIAFSVLKIAKARTGKSFYIQGDVQNLNFIRENSFDCLLCSEVIEHVLHPEAVFSEAFRILKPGGLFLLTTPNHSGQKPTWIPVDEMREFGVRGVVDDRYFHSAFRPEELQSLAERAGFEILECGTFEKEVKYAARIPLLLFHFIRIINKFILRRASVDRYNRRLLNSGALLVYRLAAGCGLERWLTRFVKEGVRSFIFLKKPAA